MRRLLQLQTAIIATLAIASCKYRSPNEATSNSPQDSAGGTSFGGQGATAPNVPKDLVDETSLGGAGGLSVTPPPSWLEWVVTEDLALHDFVVLNGVVYFSEVPSLTTAGTPVADARVVEYELATGKSEVLVEGLNEGANLYKKDGNIVATWQGHFYAIAPVLHEPPLSLFEADEREWRWDGRCFFTQSPVPNGRRFAARCDGAEESMILEVEGPGDFWDVTRTHILYDMPIDSDRENRLLQTRPRSDLTSSLDLGHLGGSFELSVPRTLLVGQSGAYWSEYGLEYVGPHHTFRRFPLSGSGSHPLPQLMFGVGIKLTEYQRPLMESGDFLIFEIANRGATYSTPKNGHGHIKELEHSSIEFRDADRGVAYFRDGDQIRGIALE